MTLMIEGDAPALARIIASLDGSGGVIVTNHTGAPTIAPGSALAAVAGAAGAVPAGDDDNGPADPGAPSVDSSGLPWDERIHAKTKATIGDGTWRKKRGVDDATIAAVETELRARVSGQPAPMQPPVAQPMPSVQPAVMPAGQPAPIVMPTTQPPVVQPMPMPTTMQPPFDPAAGSMPMQPAGAPVGMVSPAVAAAPVYSPPVEQPAMQPASVAPAAGSMDFAQFMQHLQTQMTKVDAAGTPLIHADYLANLTREISTAYNTQLGSFTDIANQPAMISYAVQLLQRDQRW